MKFKELPRVSMCIFVAGLFNPLARAEDDSVFRMALSEMF